MKISEAVAHSVGVREVYISRKAWSRDGVVEKYIHFSQYCRSYEITIVNHVPIREISAAWNPSWNDMVADDWFVCLPPSKHRRTWMFWVMTKSTNQNGSGNGRKDGNDDWYQDIADDGLDGSE